MRTRIFVLRLERREDITAMPASPSGRDPAVATQLDEDHSG